ncbi:MAG: hypothetical protein JW801_00345 [Bacteroidales bacterium]|nr:hypothetical protein [Bacteroidales bacterium]
MEKSNTYRCKRCNKPASSDMLCQSCKSALLANFEATSDWQTAYEIEKAQWTASRYQTDEYEDADGYQY